MSTTKRTRQRQPEQAAVTSMPPAKRAKITKPSQDPSSGLGFLTDERRRSGRIIQAKITNGTDNSRLNKIDESQAAISGQAALDDAEEEEEEGEVDGDDDGDAISSSSEEPSSSSEDDAADVLMTNGVENHDVPHADVDELENGAMDISEEEETNHVPKTNGITDDEPEQDENTAPSFGEMLQTVHPEIIDVTASLDDQEFPFKSLVRTEGSTALQAPSATSLGTVLSQALKTNDKELLESCFQTKDTATIKATIQRLESRHVSNLMQKLAERLHKTPGRSGPLIVWVQWCLVAHGGYLAGQQKSFKKLRPIRHVVKERARSFQPLAPLKGKLDLLDTQVELRRSIRAQHADGDDSDEENDVVYVEGDDASSSSDEDDDDDLKLIKQTPHRSSGLNGTNDLDSRIDISEDLDGDVPIINGIDEDAEMESLADEDEGEDQENEGLIDDEAEESEGAESVSSEEEASESEDDDQGADNDDDSSSSEDVPAAPPTRSRPTRRAALIRKR